MKTSILLLTILLASPAYAKEMMIGVLEQPQSCSGVKPKPAVRLLFGKSDGNWAVLKTKKSTTPFTLNRIDWTAAFDGKNIGEVTSEEPTNEVADDWTYPRDYLQRIKSISGRIEITNPKDRFIGWCGAPTIRPVVLVSQPNYRDPDAWSPFKPDSTMRKKLFKEFKRTAGKAPLCYIKDNEYFPFKYEANNLKFLKSYKSNKGMLIQVTLDRPYTRCNDELGEGASPRWFYVRGSMISFIGDGMELVDAGDYDGDGKSEILFWYSGYDKDGYILFYDDLTKKSEFLWIYH